MLSGWSTIDYSYAFSLRRSGKVSWFDNHQKFLPQEHPFRRNKKAFTKGRRVINEYLGIRFGDDILDEIEATGLLKVTEHDADKINAKISKSCGWKKKIILWDLPY